MGTTSRDSSSAAATIVAAGAPPVRSAPRVLEPGSLSTVNPAEAKAAVLDAVRNGTWNASAGGEVISYTSLLTAIQNRTAATVPAPGESA